jgi:uridylate kinase
LCNSLIKGKRMKYKRILLKLSGEILRNKAKGQSIDSEVLTQMAVRVKELVENNVQVGIVIGGGNIFRGLSGEQKGIDRTSGDYMGMMATIINSLALQNALEKNGVDTRVMSAIEMRQVAEPFILRRALRHFDKGRVLIFAGGTGNPYFSTDSAAALRASEINADLLIKATKVDGIYTADPTKDASATKYHELSYTEALSKSLKVMDGAAFSLCMENNIPIVVSSFFDGTSLLDIADGKTVGTLVH